MSLRRLMMRFLYLRLMTVVFSAVVLVAMAISLGGCEETPEQIAARQERERIEAAERMRIASLRASGYEEVCAKVTNTPLILPTIDFNGNIGMSISNIAGCDKYVWVCARPGGCQ